MNIKEFVSQYCSDIMAEAKRRSEMFDLSGFSYDEIIKEDDGAEVRVVNTANYQIPIIDILGMDRAEFSKVWRRASRSISAQTCFSKGWVCIMIHPSLLFV